MNSEPITKNDLKAILNEVLPPTPSEYRKLLWTNPSPTSAFASGTATCEIGYDAYIIEYIGYTGQSEVISSIRLDSEQSYLFHITGSTSATGGVVFFFKRNVWRDTNGISFGNVYSSADGTQWSIYNANTGCIPYKIYGIKYKQVLPPTEEYTPPSGYGTGVGITSYGSASNYYTCPSNGIVRIQCWYTSGNWINAHVANADGSNEIEFQQASSGVGHRMIAVPVFKGQRVWITQNGSSNNAIFYPFI